MEPWMIVAGALIFSALALIKGIKGLRDKRIAFSGKSIGQPNNPIGYEGLTSVAPSIALIFLGSIIPLVMLAIYLQYYLKWNYAMPVIIVGGMVIALVSIVVLMVKFKK